MKVLCTQLRRLLEKRTFFRSGKVFTFALFVMLACVACKSTPPAEPALEPQPAPVEEKPAPVEEKPEPVPEPPAPEPAAPDFTEANSALFEKLDDARAKAVEAGAKTAYPDVWKAAEADYEKLKADYASEPKADYAARVRDLVERYEALEKASQALAMKKKLDSLNVDDYDKAVYKAGEEALAKYAQEGSKASADAAYDAYKTALNKALLAMAGRERKAALEAKKAADSVKAGVSQKDAYAQAAEAFKRADASYVAQNIEAAFKDYQNAKNAFDTLYKTVSERLAATQAAIARAKQKSSESADYATNADTLAPLGDAAVSGIEEENAVLLEEDKLANPEDAVIDVNAGETAQSAQASAEAAIAAEEAASTSAQGAQ